MKKVYRSLAIALLAALSLTACVVVAPVEEEAAAVSPEVRQAYIDTVMYEAFHDCGLGDLADGQIAPDGQTLVGDMTLADMEALVQQHYRSVREAAWAKANLNAFAESQLTIGGKRVADLTHADFHLLAGL